MTTPNDMVIANADGASFRADVNGALQALASQSANASAPGTTYPNQLWYDTTTGILKKRNNANSAWEVFGAVLPTPGLMFGCGTANNATDATNDIDFSAGVCTDYTKSVSITVAAMTKQLDANWAAGNNAGMRYSGAAITNTTYHLYAVAKADSTQDFYADPSASEATALGHLQAETGGASYIYARRVASIVRTGGAIKGYIQDGDLFRWKAPTIDITATNPGTSAVTRTLTLPVGIRVEADVSAYGSGTTSADLPNGILLSDLSTTDTAASNSAFSAYVSSGATGSQAGGAPVRVFTNTSAQIRSRLETSTGSTSLRIVTNGYRDDRGRV